MIEAFTSHLLYSFSAACPFGASYGSESLTFIAFLAGALNCEISILFLERTACTGDGLRPNIYRKLAAEQVKAQLLLLMFCVKYSSIQELPRIGHSVLLLTFGKSGAAHCSSLRRKGVIRLHQLNSGSAGSRLVASRTSIYPKPFQLSLLHIFKAACLFSASHKSKAFTLIA